jgi:hypothetical protein
MRKVRRATVMLAALSWFAAPALAQDSHLLVVVGLGGEEESREMFHRWATDLVVAAKTRYGLAPEHVLYLAERAETEGAAGRSTREEIDRAVDRMTSSVRPGDRVFVVLFGHGSFANSEARFNLPGPDLTAAEFAALLDRFGEQSVAFVNTTSSSGAFLGPLAGRNRAVLTATRTGGERNETLFGGFFVEAFIDGEGDLDKDGRLSMLEAFTWAKRRVAEAYSKENLLLTEHAAIDDDGDGKGSLEPDPMSGDGALARTMILAGRTADPAAGADDPELRVRLERRRDLEDQVARLRLSKDRMTPDQYEKELERLLIELARTSREIRTWRK